MHHSLASSACLNGKVKMQKCGKTGVNQCQQAEDTHRQQSISSPFGLVSTILRATVVEVVLEQQKWKVLRQVCTAQPAVAPFIDFLPLPQMAHFYNKPVCLSSVKTDMTQQHFIHRWHTSTHKPVHCLTVKTDMTQQHFVNLSLNQYLLAWDKYQTSMMSCKNATKYSSILKD